MIKFKTINKCIVLKIDEHVDIVILFDMIRQLVMISIECFIFEHDNQIDLNESNLFALVVYYIFQPINKDIHIIGIVKIFYIFKPPSFVFVN